MSKKLKTVISYNDYVKKGPEALQGRGMVVGSDIVPSDAVDLAMDHNEIYIVANDTSQKRFESIEGNFPAFINDPAPFLIDMNCPQRKFLQETLSLDTKKSEFLKSIEAFLNSASFRKTRTDLLLVIDELFTNFMKVSSEKREVDFFLDSDENRVLVGCRDTLGLLDPVVMLKNIQKCYKFGIKSSISADKEGGAGIGSFLMYNVSEGMALVTEDHKRSMVLFWLTKSQHHNCRIDSKKDIIVSKNKGDN